MKLYLWSSAIRKKIEFVPIDTKNVRVYVCGPTVYDFAHIGNARPAVVFDILNRVLRKIYEPQNVIYVSNVTDVDDKINFRAKAEGVDISKVTSRFVQQWVSDTSALGVIPPSYQPRATEHIIDMVQMIQALIDKKHAYEKDGHVLFDVSTMADYCELSGRNLVELIAGARVEIASYKDDPMDFVLWKPSAPAEPAWESPWGKGRPGWHIECSAMCHKYLGERFDIHAGGIDLLFPHHENESAQSKAAFGNDKMANYWLHNGMLNCEGDKMSKSLGNFVTINELLTGWKGKKWHGSIIRLALLMTYYRSPLDFTEKRLKQAEAKLLLWGKGLCAYFGAEKLDKLLNKLDIKGVNHSDKLEESVFMNCLLDDLNTWQAIVELDSYYRQGKFQELLEGINFLGLSLLPRATSSLSLQEIESLIEQRIDARKCGDYEKADKLRAYLANHGVVLRDVRGSKKVEWEYSR